MNDRSHCIKKTGINMKLMKFDDKDDDDNDEWITA